MSFAKAEAPNLPTLPRPGERRKRPASAWRAWSACLLLVAVALSGCGGSRGDGGGAGPQVANPPQAQQPVEQPVLLPPPEIIAEALKDDKIRVALLVPLSGSEERIGRALQNAAELALFDTADQSFVLRPYDSGGGGDSARAEAAVQAAVADGADMILGPLFGASTTAIAPYARAAQVPVLSFSNDEAVAGDGVYVLGFLPRDQVRRVVNYAEVNGLTRFAAFVPSTPYGRSVASALQSATSEAGVQAVKISYYDPSTPDLTPSVKEFTEHDRRARQQPPGEVPFQAILLPDGAERLRAIGPMLAYYDVDSSNVRLLGTSIWEAGDVTTEPTLVGGWYAAPGPDERAAFDQRYRAAFGSAPPAIAGLAYDATALAAALARDPAAGGFTPARLTASDGFAGVNGIFRLRADGLNERGLAVYEVGNGEKRVIDPAPQSFAPPLIN